MSPSTLYALNCGESVLRPLSFKLTYFLCNAVQLLGVCSGGICNVNIQYWLDPGQPAATVMLSSNSKQMIDDAQRYWEPLAVAAILFHGHGFVCGLVVPKKD